ncbi:MAG TPA: transposase [Sphingobacteriaceae bacterium]|jgi:putative transposase
MVNILKQMTPAMTGYLKGLIYRNTRTSCVCLASLSEIAHDQLYRLLYADFPYSRRLWEWFAAKLIGGRGYLVLDDTTWRRFTKRAEAVSFVWDSSVGKVVFGMSVVLLIWTDGKRKVPLGIRVWKKGGKSKVELAAELLRQAHERGLSPEFVLFDSWYAARSLLELIEDFSWRYISATKRNRLFEGVKIGNYFHHRFGRAIGSLKRFRHQILLVKNGQKFLISNDVSLTSRAVKSHYRFRQQVEETFRLLKQEFGWGKCRARSVKAQTAHLHLGLYALCLVQMKAAGETVYQFKQNLFRAAIPTQNQFIEAFTVAA